MTEIDLNELDTFLNHVMLGRYELRRGEWFYFYW